MKLTKKNIFVLLSVFVLAFVVAFSFQHVFNSSKDLTTDSGFDSDFGDSGGGSDFGGSSFDSDYDSGGSGGSINSSGDLIMVIFAFMFITFIYYLFIHSGNANRRAKEDANFFEENYYDPGVVLEAYNIYVRVQEAWAKNNLEDVRDVLSPEMYNMYNSQIQTMIRKKQKNVMLDFQYVRGVIRDYQSIDGQDRYVIILQVHCKDYLIDDVTHKVISGSSMRVNDYIYSLTFLRNKSVDVDKCPNCNAELPSTGQNVKCEYCGSVIERKSANLVLVEKKMLRQR